MASAPQNHLVERAPVSLAQFRHRGTIVVGTTQGKQQLHLEHLVREHQTSTKFRHRGTIVVGTTPGKQQLHLEHVVRGHQTGTVPAPGDNCGGHHSRKAAPAPAGSDWYPCLFLRRSRRLLSLYSWGIKLIFCRSEKWGGVSGVRLIQGADCFQFFGLQERVSKETMKI